MCWQRAQAEQAILAARRSFDDGVWANTLMHSNAVFIWNFTNAPATAELAALLKQIENKHHRARAPANTWPDPRESPRA